MKDLILWPTWAIFLLGLSCYVIPFVLFYGLLNIGVQEKHVESLGWLMIYLAGGLCAYQIAKFNYIKNRLI
jgi:hypothetical protein